MKDFLKFLLTTPDANSRAVFFCQGVAIALSIVILSAVYVSTKDHGLRDGFVTMMTVLLGGGSVSALSRGYSKRIGSSIDADDKKV